MSINSLSTFYFRNLKDHQSINLHNKLNIIIGENASGKTSLLEAIYYLSTGKSFRTHLIENVLNTRSDSSEFIIFGQLISSINNESLSDTHKVGLKRSRKEKSLIKIDGEIVSSASVLASISPTLIIQPSTFELLDGSPKVRRKFLDWGVFHVEHAFGPLWKEYIYCLKQRNTLLRNARIDDLQLRVWDKRLAELGEGIDKYRNAFLGHYNECLERLTKAFNLPNHLRVKYYKGWEKTKSFEEILDQSRTKDLDRKYTQNGPHRADIKITVDGKHAEQALSRGQQKLLIIAMHLAHIELVSRLTKKASVTLIDDVTAELDQKNLALIFECLSASNTQVICTGIEGERIMSLLEYNQNYKVFHVEHGEIKEQQ